MHRALACLALATLAACSRSPAPAPAAHPALWQIAGPQGQSGWLFGTIHALPDEVDWRSAAINHAIEQADQLVVEVAALADDSATAQEFNRRAAATGLPSLSARIALAQRPALLALLARQHISENRLSGLDTWAAALIIAQNLQGGSDSGNGIDRALLHDEAGKKVNELEGAATQFGIFDSLPESTQRVLLAAVINGADNASEETTRLAKAWRNGDMAVIESETHSGLLADPELRQALFLKRNRAWTQRLAALMASGGHPFAAVGAAHMAGSDGLPAMLAAKGYTITRIQ